MFYFYSLWLTFDFFICSGNINSKIENIIKSKIPPLINNLINSKGNEILSKLATTKKIGNDAEVNYYLTQNPTSNSDAMSVYLSGEFVKPTMKGDE